MQACEADAQESSEEVPLTTIPMKASTKAPIAASCRRAL